MPIVDDRTPNKNLALPNAANLGTDDVARLRTALSTIDALLQGIDTSLAGKASGADLLSLSNDLDSAVSDLTIAIHGNVWIFGAGDPDNGGGQDGYNYWYSATGKWWKKAAGAWSYTGLAFLPASATAVNATKWGGAAKTVSTLAPSGGVDGDIWFEREA